MKDKGLNLFLMAIFGAGGIAILILAWVQSMALPERILITFVGSVGVLWALIQGLFLTSILKRSQIGHR